MILFDKRIIMAKYAVYTKWYWKNGVKSAEQCQERMAQHRGQPAAEDIIWWQIDDNHYQAVIIFSSEDVAKAEFANIEEYRKSDFQAMRTAWHLERPSYANAHPAIQGKGLPTILPIRLIPATDRIIIEIEKLRDLRAAFSIIQQQKSIRTSPNPVILTLAANTAFQLKSVFGGKKMWADHEVYRIYPFRNVNKIFGFSVTRSISKTFIISELAAYFSN